LILGSIQSDRHDAAQSRRSEFEPAEKAAFDLLFVALQSAQFFPFSVAERRGFGAVSSEDNGNLVKLAIQRAEQQMQSRNR
jgi:hypothetical protein